MADVACKYCGNTFSARQADINRGWAKFCSKSCKAKDQTKRTGISGAHYKASGMTVSQMASGKYAKSIIYRGNGYVHDDCEDFDTHPFSSEALGQW